MPDELCGETKESTPVIEGPLSDTQLQVVAIGSSLVSGGTLGALIRLFISIGSKLNKAESASRIAEVAFARVEAMDLKLQEHKLEVMREINLAIRASDVKISEAFATLREDQRMVIDSMSQAMRDNTTRLDRILEMSNKR